MPHGNDFIEGGEMTQLILVTNFTNSEMHVKTKLYTILKFYNVILFFPRGYTKLGFLDCGFPNAIYSYLLCVAY